MFQFQFFLVFVAIFSLPAALLSLQLAFIGVSGFSIPLIGAILLIGAISGIVAGLLELLN